MARRSWVAENIDREYRREKNRKRQIEERKKSENNRKVSNRNEKR